MTSVACNAPDRSPASRDPTTSDGRRHCDAREGVRDSPVGQSGTEFGCSVDHVAPRHGNLHAQRRRESTCRAMILEGPPVMFERTDQILSRLLESLVDSMRFAAVVDGFDQPTPKRFRRCFDRESERSTRAVRCFTTVPISSSPTMLDSD